VNYKILLCALLLLSVPACRKKAHRQDKKATTSSQEAPRGMHYDEELGEFVLNEDQNPFAPASEVTLSSAPELVAVTDLSQRETARHGFKTLYFGFDRYAIRPDQKPTLAFNSKRARELIRKGNRIVIEGHACNSAGSNEHNMLLSERRAEAVAKQFVKDGIDKKHITTVGRGSEMRIVPSGNREQQAPNRRVELYAFPTK